MPKRTREHIVGDLALQRVAYQFTREGCACEVVEKDYGEDLIVQLIWRNKVEPYRLWIQVKGTLSSEKLRSLEGHFALQIAKETLEKWIDSPDLIVLALWDVQQDLGYWCIPAEIVDRLSVVFSSAAAYTLHVSDKQLLNASGVETILSKARMRHYGDRLEKCSDNDASFLVRSAAPILGHEPSLQEVFIHQDQILEAMNSGDVDRRRVSGETIDVGLKFLDRVGALDGIGWSDELLFWHEMIRGQLEESKGEVGLDHEMDGDLDRVATTGAFLNLLASSMPQAPSFSLEDAHLEVYVIVLYEIQFGSVSTCRKELSSTGRIQAATTVIERLTRCLS